MAKTKRIKLVRYMHPINTSHKGWTTGHGHVLNEFYLCKEALDELYEIPDHVKEIEIVFSKTKVRNASPAKHYAITASNAVIETELKNRITKCYPLRRSTSSWLGRNIGQREFYWWVEYES